MPNWAIIDFRTKIIAKNRPEKDRFQPVWFFLFPKLPTDTICVFTKSWQKNQTNWKDQTTQKNTVISKRNFNRLEALKQEKNHKFDIYMENLKQIIDGDKDFNEYLQYIETFLK